MNKVQFFLKKQIAISKRKGLVRCPRARFFFRESENYKRTLSDFKWGLSFSKETGIRDLRNKNGQSFTHISKMFEKVGPYSDTFASELKSLLEFICKCAKQLPVQERNNWSYVPTALRKIINDLSPIQLGGREQKEFGQSGKKTYITGVAEYRLELTNHRGAEKAKGENLGKGANARVRLGQDGNGTSVAVKKIATPFIADKFFDAFFDALIGKRLASAPESCVLIDHSFLSWNSKGEAMIYQVMRYVDGVDIYAALQVPEDCKGESQFFIEFPSIRDRISAVFPVISALDYLNSQGIGHFDLKQENVLLSKSRSLYLCDFALALIPEADDKHNQRFRGTPEYIAPEMLLASLNSAAVTLGTPVDAWALGIFLCETVFGSYPFLSTPDSNYVQSVYEKIIRFSEYKNESSRTKALLQLMPTVSLGQNEDSVERQLFLVVVKLLDPNPKTRMTVADLKKELLKTFPALAECHTPS